MSSPENPPIDERFDGLVSELRAARPVAPDDLRRRVAAIAARPPAPPRKLRVTWVLAPAAAALAAGSDRRRRAVRWRRAAAAAGRRAARRAGDQGFGHERARGALGRAGGAREARAALFGRDHPSRQGSVRRHAGRAAADEGSRRLRPHGRLRRGPRGGDGAPCRPRSDRPCADRDPPLLRARHDPRPARVGARRAARARPALRHASPSCGGSSPRCPETTSPPHRPSSRRCRPRRPGTGARRASRRCRST